MVEFELGTCIVPWPSNNEAEQHFRLNLIGESAILNKKYITTMREKSGMRFEAVLDFVKLPYWRPGKFQGLENEALGIHDAPRVWGISR